jgi:hypothetical protein
MKPPDSLRARVLAAAAATPSPTRSQGNRVAVVLAVVSLVVATVVFELTGGLAHSAGRPLGITIAVAGGWSAAAAFLTWLAVGRGRSTLARHPLLLVIAAMMSPVALFVWMRVFYGTYQEPFHRAGYRCLAYTLIMAVTPLATFLWLRRGVAPSRPSALGAAAGAACGAWAGVIIDLWCPLTAPAHALLGHVLPLTLVIIVGAVLGDRMLGVSRRKGKGLLDGARANAAPTASRELARR